MDAVAELVLAQWRLYGESDPFWQWAWDNYPETMTALVTLEYERIHGEPLDQPREWTGSRLYAYS